ncbi:SDR family NAD(P)-dependent oxidoreductase [Dactylosporangium darangshiense]|uniref:3-oxoacyl-[acyl-carrier-protein] reductase n=1 Tax=Dactylosporangium darangshiense TaxID=579108 RepID=A0ABP8DJH5_9ACTN
MDLGLEGRCVLVTGASSGIGRATAVAFGAAGARVAVGYHINETGAAETVSAVETGGGTAAAVRLDLGDERSIAGAVERIGEMWGPVDVLVNNAVAWPGFPAAGETFETAPVEKMRASLRANLEGPYLLSRAVVGGMRRRGWGRIAHVSTGLVEDGMPGSAAYVTAKAGLHGLNRVMSRELAAAGILTNVVMAGFVPAGKPIPPAVQQQAADAAAIRRVSEAGEVAEVIVFLCSARNTNVTGQAVRADGHFLTPMPKGAGT